jgi:hypothetical protein
MFHYPGPETARPTSAFNTLVSFARTGANATQVVTIPRAPAPSADVQRVRILQLQTTWLT